jgi:uncharacterized Tic20 family protein
MRSIFSLSVLLLLILLQYVIFALITFPLWRRIRRDLVEIYGEDNLNSKKRFIFFLLLQIIIIAIGLISAGLVLLISREKTLKLKDFFLPWFACSLTFSFLALLYFRRIVITKRDERKDHR